jgi:hypothetical protein
VNLIGGGRLRRKLNVNFFHYGKQSLEAVPFLREGFFLFGRKFFPRQNFAGLFLTVTFDPQWQIHLHIPFISSFILKERPGNVFMYHK